MKNLIINRLVSEELITQNSGLFKNITGNENVIKN